MVHTTAHYVNFINVSLLTPHRRWRSEEWANDRWRELRFERRLLSKFIMLKLEGSLVIRMSLSTRPLLPRRWLEEGMMLRPRVLLIMFLMYTTAHHSIRKQCFEAFWYTHHLVRPSPPAHSLDYLEIAHTDDRHFSL